MDMQRGFTRLRRSGKSVLRFNHPPDMPEAVSLELTAKAFLRVFVPLGFWANYALLLERIGIRRVY
jgi:hypothetical protein